jgi:hypothetical protein
MLPEKKAKKSKKRLDFWVNNPYNMYIFNNKSMRRSQHETSNQHTVQRKLLF